MLVGSTRKVSKQVQGTLFGEVTLPIPLREKLMVGYGRVSISFEGIYSEPVHMNSTSGLMTASDKFFAYFHECIKIFTLML